MVKIHLLPSVDGPRPTDSVEQDFHQRKHVHSDQTKTNPTGHSYLARRHQVMPNVPVQLPALYISLHFYMGISQVIGVPPNLPCLINFDNKPTILGLEYFKQF